MPQTPTHSRHPSHISISSPSPASSHSRRQSKNSIHTPTTPHHFDRSNSIGIDVFSSGAGGGGQGNGLGNLADELADAWSEDSEEAIEEEDLEFQNANAEGQQEGVRDSGVDVRSLESPTEFQQGRRNGHATRPKSINLGTLSPESAKESAKSATGRGHRRQVSEYDGSDYGGDSDLDSPGLLPPSLVARMDMVEGLARRGMEETGGPTDGVVERVVEGLRDLGGQGGVEGGATRLITTHTALSTHLLHQTRLLHTLTYPLLSSLSTPSFDPTLLTLLDLFPSLLTTLPRPPPTALQSLSHLHSLTADLIQTLSHLSDTLHMSRQTTTSAARRLRSAKELVTEMRKEQELAEEGERWLRKGGWEERLRRREVGRECEGVVGGFERACEGVRGRLVEMERMCRGEGVVVS